MYLDTSAVGRVLLGEPGHEKVLAALAEFNQHVSSQLMRVELSRLGLRHGVLAGARSLAASVAMVPLSESVLALAETITPEEVASLDAIHLATAVTLSDGGEVGAMMTYDRALADGARSHRLEVISP